MTAAVGSTIPVAVLLPVLLRRMSGRSRSVRRAPAGVRSALRFLVAGTVGYAVGPLLVLSIDLARDVPALAPAGAAARSALAACLSLTGASTVLLLLVGLLRLPGVVASDGARLRHTLDGLAIGVSVLVVVWLALRTGVGLSGADSAGRPGPDPQALVVAASGLPMVAAVGVLVVTVFRATIARPALVACALGLVGVGSAVHGMSGAVRDGAAGRLAWWAVVGPVGLLVAVGTATRVRLLWVRAPAQVRTTMAFTVVPTLVALGVTLLYTALVGPPDRVAVFGAVLLGVGLAGRQAVAHREIQAQAVALAEQGERFRKLALTDPLTSLANRRRLLDTLRADDQAGEPCVLISIDLDGFKNVNDLRGHDVGDMVLSQVAKRLRDAIRPGDLAARLGGDEFAVVLHAPLGRAQQIAERLLTTLSAPYQAPDGSVTLSASIGLAGTGDGDLSSLLHNADVALRAAKQRGKNRIERYAVADERWLRRRTALERHLRHALSRAELSLAYQPVLPAQGGPPVGVEALLRWHNATLGQVPAVEFIPIAEEAGLITAVDRWVLHQACHQLALWRSAGYGGWVSVNVSSVDLRRPEFVAEVAEVLRAHGTATPALASQLVLEAPLHDPALDGQDVAATLRRLRALGLRVALDQFGAGGSDLGQVTGLPLDVLKIHISRMFDTDFGGLRRGGAPDPRATAVLRAIASLGAGLGLDVIAYGVLRADQQDLVAAAGLALAQGDRLRPALPAEHVEALLCGTAPILVTRTGAQDMRQVDSGHEMRQS